MAEAVSGPAGTSDGVVPDGPDGLKSGAIGLLGATMLGVVIMGPGLAILFSWGFTIPAVGTATAILFIYGMALTLPTAGSYAVLNSRVPSAGATYKWATMAFGRVAGVATGLCTVLFYTFIVIFTFPLQAQFFSDLVGTSSRAVFIAVTIGSFMLMLPFVYRGVAFNLDTAVFLAVAEMIIVAAIAIGALIASDDGLSLAPLNPADLPGVTALMPALVLAFLAFTGYDAVSTVAEESDTPAKLIPKATILSVVVIGAFWVFVATVLSSAVPVSTYTETINAGGFPLGAAAEQAFGSTGRVVTNIMGLEAAFALSLGAMIGASRILYRMGRDGAISQRFGTVHPKFQTPWFSISSIIAFIVLAGAALSAYLGLGFEITLWSVNVVAFFSLITYIVINACNAVVSWRHFRGEFNWFTNVLVPAIGVAAVGWFFYKGFFQALWNVEGKLGQSVVWICLALLAAICGAALLMAQRPRLAAESTRPTHETR